MHLNLSDSDRNSTCVTAWTRPTSDAADNVDNEQVYTRRAESRRDLCMHEANPDDTTLLIVAADPALREFIRKSVAAPGRRIHQAAGCDAVAELLKTTLPTLVICDVESTRSEALAVCRALREAGDARRLPIIALVDMTDHQLLSMARDAGASDYLIKPLDAERLGLRIEQVLGTRAAHQELTASRARLEVLNELVADTVLIVRRDGTVLECLSGTGGDTFLPQEDLRGQVLADIWPEDIATGLLQHVKRTLRNRRASEYEFKLDVGDQVRTYQSRFIAQGRNRVLLQLRNTTHEKTAEVRIDNLANNDVLTGLPNRHLFLQMLEHALTDARLKERELAVIYIDVEHFGKINDSFGRSTGDLVLKVIGERIRGCLRGPDSLRNGTGAAIPTVARWSADRFTVLLDEVSSARDAKAIAARIRTALRQPVTIPGQELEITPHMGAALYPRDGESIESLLHTAETAMHDARTAALTLTGMFASEDEGTLERLDMANELRWALKNNQLSLHYQPKIELESGLITGAEALLRWAHPLRGPVMPMAIIPLAEQTGMIGAIGEWVFRAACLQVLDWQQRGLECQAVAVNFSSKHFFEPGFPQALADILTETGVNPGALEIEIAEQLLRQDAREGFAVIKRLIDTGLRVAIDDFGTGYSCIPELVAAGINTVKIDHSLIKPLPENEGCGAVSSAMIAMCRELGITSVAEGVESRAQLQLLRQQHCDQVQGFIYTEALPAEAFETFLREYLARTFEGVTELEQARA